MSIDEALLGVPLEQRERFLAQAREVEARARLRGASSSEVALALGVLRALCGGVAPVVSAAPVVRA